METIQVRYEKILKISEEVLNVAIDINNYTTVAISNIKELKNLINDPPNLPKDTIEAIIQCRKIYNKTNNLLEIIEDTVSRNVSFIEKSSSSPNPIRPYDVFRKKTELDEEIFAQNKQFAETMNIELKDLENPNKIDIFQMAIHQGKISIDDGYDILFGQPCIWEYQQYSSNGVIIEKNNKLPVITEELQNTVEIIPSTEAIEKINNFGLSVDRGLDKSILHLFTTTAPIDEMKFSKIPKDMEGLELAVRKLPKGFLLMYKSPYEECNTCMNANQEINTITEMELGPYVPELNIPTLSDEVIRNKDKIGVILNKMDGKKVELVDVLNEVFDSQGDVDKATSIFAYEKKVFGRSPKFPRVKARIRDSIRELNSIYSI